MSSAPASTCSGTSAAKTQAHIVLSCRLIALNCGESQYWRGTDSRAYCSVNGTNNSEPNAISASSAAAIARA